MCLQGVSATNAVLKFKPIANVKVFVIWEPITFGDFNLPPDSALHRVPDARVAQYFDRNHLVSKALRDQMLAHGVTGEDYFVKAKDVWDTVAVYAPGARWEVGSGATPEFVGAPVVNSSEQLTGFLR